MTGDTLGGYRLVRKLGEGPRAEVHLAYPRSDSDDARAVAIKVFRPTVGDTAAITEIEALSRAAGDHVVTLIDLAGGPDGAPALILERVAGGSLGRLLRDRASLRQGEAITILVPLARTLRRLHDNGVVHGGLRLEAVAFDGTGAPVLSCFGSASLIEPRMPPARLEQEQGVIRDLDDFARVARAVLDRLPLPVSLPDPGQDWLERVEQVLFDLGAPEAVQLRSDGPAELAPPARILTAPPVPPEPEVGGRGGLLSLVLPDWLDGAGLAVSVHRWASRARRAVLAVRARAWIALGAVAGALVLAAVLIPSSPPGATAGPAPHPSLSPTPTASNAGGDDVVAGDDPLAALPELLALRERCIRDLSVLCLDDVDQPGSAALAEDQLLVRSLQQGSEQPDTLRVSASDLTLEERLGDSALVSLGDVTDSEPASLLMMKSEAGWRIRDYLER
ncbi:MAG TPA: protein kinase [Rhodoglobus sp.]|nr:protein kinase [Rhodoglobus sp.]